MNRVTDKDIQTVIGNLLRIGVVLSMATVLIGAVIYLFGNAGKTVEYHTFDDAKVHLKSIKSIFTNLPALEGITIIQLGLLMLIFTPIARIVMAAVSFFIEKDYLYVLICIIVLLIIAMSLSGGFAH
ncbi:DUF1634 domain-containing protein [Pedobacter montanisoli]|uniref:DUF1634 domain-containing protein n=1 Tax=Pedobacter montanisoli TaxID=2923277 RepID=A0ABS9ZUH4_9SPHI|nr:DUF1634 domain-containing protein [Pedobacter montanisoli]MCJ0742255.1 DUF1634 domain-containing protein [Pedobacter montanisoli]